MRDGKGFAFYDLRRGLGGSGIELLFPGWREGDERVVVFSPHDDDGLLGAGYLIRAAAAFGAAVHVVVFCSGDAGYSDPADREAIVGRRRAETTAAYGALGVGPEAITRLELPDFSVLPMIGRVMPWGGEGTFAVVLPLLRRLRATRLAIPNRHREHVDHEAVGRIGASDGPQAGDPMLVDLAEPYTVRSFLEYAVWGDFSPEDELVHGSEGPRPSRRARGIRANRAIRAPAAVEDRVRGALGLFASQQEIIAGLLDAREERACRGGFLELYVAFDPRPRLDYGPYRRLVEEIDADARARRERA
jgi:LmbE family N-acetylglucosaminyl deacetylase